MSKYLVITSSGKATNRQPAILVTKKGEVNILRPHCIKRWGVIIKDGNHITIKDFWIENDN